MKLNHETTLNNSAFYMKMVDIIIPYHGQYDKVTKLIESIYGTVRSNRYQLTLVDDGSPNESYLNSLKKLKILAIRNEEQRGFGYSVNQAIKQTRLPYIAIIQSDVVVDHGKWLSELGNSLLFMKNNGVKMVSPKTNNPVVDDSDLLGERRDFENKVDKVIDGFLPMYCTLSHRELFSKVGLLKEYPYAGGEAEEFAYRMRKNGYSQAVCGKSWVHHEGRATLKQYDKSGKVQRVIEESNRQLQKDLGQTHVNRTV